MNEHDLEQDRIVQMTLQDYYENIEIPDTTESWQKVQERLNKQRQQKKAFFRLKIAVAVLATALFIEVTTTTNIPKSYANVSSLFREIKHSVVEFFFVKEKQDSSIAKTNRPSTEIDTKELSLPEEVRLDDATTKLSFPMLLPDFIPNDFTLDVVRIYREADGQYKNVYLEYIRETKDIFKISQRLIEPRSTNIKSDIPVDAGTIKEINENGNNSVLVLMPEGFVALEWFTKDNIKVSISGKLTESEIMQIAESLH